MSIHIGYYLESGPPHWYPGDAASWAAEVEPVKTRERQAIRDRLDALARWYGIELNREANLGDGFHELAFALAEAHVPGFAVGKDLGAKLPGRGAPPTLTIPQTIFLSRCVHHALIAGMTEDAAIARLARQKIKVPSRGSRKARKDGGRAGSKPLPRPTATHLVKEMRSAWEDVLKGNASSFQFCVVTMALTSRKDDDDDPDWGVVFGLHR